MSSRKTKAKTAKKRPAQYALAHVLVNNEKRDCSGLHRDLFLFHFPISSGDSSLSLGLLPIFSMRLRPSNKRQVKNCTKNVGWKWLEAVQKRSASGHCSKVGRVWKWPAKGSPVARLRCLENGKHFSFVEFVEFIHSQIGIFHSPRGSSLQQIGENRAKR